ncbi:MAG: ABC transporter, partial [Rhodocyclaceae bacterium]|nr:ABC transporter [Rhodocyclaceae bacterium]
MNSDGSTGVKKEMPIEPWRREAVSRLVDGERLEAGLPLDLDIDLRYSEGLLLLTDRRLLARSPGAEAWQEWPYRPGLRLVHGDHAGVGTLELHDGSGRLAAWRFTIGANPAALRLADEFERQLESRLSGQTVERPEEDVCPKCGAPMDGEEECPVCAREIHAPPSTRTLLRLWRFAKPYRWQLFWGFVLTLISTAAAMVPPYLSMPLMDDVLIPYQNGAPINVELVVMLLGGLFGAALLAWGLSWAKTYILSLVAEHIGSDLRTVTFEHLMGLSLEYYGGKRTGDLMARIG